MNIDNNREKVRGRCLKKCLLKMNERDDIHLKQIRILTDFTPSSLDKGSNIENPGYLIGQLCRGFPNWGSR